MAIERRKLWEKIFYDADGAVSRIEVEVQYTADNPLNDTLNITQRDTINIGPDDMNAGDEASNAARSIRTEAMIERKRPLVAP